MTWFGATVIASASPLCWPVSVRMVTSTLACGGPGVRQVQPDVRLAGTHEPHVGARVRAAHQAHARRVGLLRLEPLGHLAGGRHRRAAAVAPARGGHRGRRAGRGDGDGRDRSWRPTRSCSRSCCLASACRLPSACPWPAAAAAGGAGAAGTELTVAEPAEAAPAALAVPADDDEAACEGTAIMAMCAAPAPGAEGGHDRVTDVTAAACPAATVAPAGGRLGRQGEHGDRGEGEQHPRRAARGGGS